MLKLVQVCCKTNLDQFSTTFWSFLCFGGVFFVSSSFRRENEIFKNKKQKIGPALTHKGPSLDPFVTLCLSPSLSFCLSSSLQSAPPCRHCHHPRLICDPTPGTLHEFEIVSRSKMATLPMHERAVSFEVFPVISAALNETQQLACGKWRTLCCQHCAALPLHGQGLTMQDQRRQIVYVERWVPSYRAHMHLVLV